MLWGKKTERFMPRLECLISSNYKAKLRYISVFVIQLPFLPDVSTKANFREFVFLIRKVIFLDTLTEG